MTNEMQTKKQPAIYIPSAYCVGSGSDLYKRVSGISQRQRRAIPDGLTVLVVSHTRYQGQQYKRAIYVNTGERRQWKHRQVNDNDYCIQYVMDDDGTIAPCRQEVR